MLSVLANLSNIMIPLIIFYIVAEGLLSKVNIYEHFIKGAKDGFEVVVTIMPTLIGLMVAVGILRASGFLELIGVLTGGLTDRFGFPSELIPVTVIKLFSSSAATGLVLDLFQKYGADSYIGLVTSIMMSCTETVFYTMSVYFMAAKVTKTRFTLTGALLATLAGIAASVALASAMI
ncbi:MAG: spore maturation protein [Lachnospiraceae bacterium]|nr:spore maturation protein [Lachnospiraceae bacterium]